jgi:metal-dependent amidase/aminoacylase/carboxypeptidase family protein
MPLTLICLAGLLTFLHGVNKDWFITEEDWMKDIGKFNWGPANVPQTTTETDGTIRRANEAMIRKQIVRKQRTMPQKDPMEMTTADWEAELDRLANEED